MVMAPQESAAPKVILIPQTTGTAAEMVQQHVGAGAVMPNLGMYALGIPHHPPPYAAMVIWVVARGFRAGKLAATKALNNASAMRLLGIFAVRSLPREARCQLCVGFTAATLVRPRADNQLKSALEMQSKGYAAMEMGLIWSIVGVAAAKRIAAPATLQ
jgi:hypothetical protein